MRRYSSHIVFAMIVGLLSTEGGQAVVVSVDIQALADGTSNDMVGVESNAAAADADFNASNVWNIAGLTTIFSTEVDSNPSWSGLVDSNGDLTTAAFSITGDVTGTTVVGAGAESALNEDSLFFANPARSTSDTLSWEISGLTPSSPFKLYLNQLDVATWVSPSQNRAMSGLIDTNGDGSPNEAYQMDFPGVLVTGTVAADGIIRGTSFRTNPPPDPPAQPFLTEPNWAGWQLSADIPSAPVLALEVITTTGEILLKNTSSADGGISYYEILSAENSLDESEWTRLAGQTGFPVGDGTGNGWEDGGTPDSGFVGEVYLDGASTVAAGTAISLGNVFDLGVDERNLTFNYLIGDDTIAGDVTYVTPAGLPGDYNGDGTVNLADYTVWRDNLGASDESALNNNGEGIGGITTSDYQFWKDRFGNTSGSASLATASAVPEPSAVLLAIISLAGFRGCARRRMTRHEA